MNSNLYKPSRITTVQSSQRNTLVPWASRHFLRELAYGSPEEFSTRKHLEIQVIMKRFLDEKQGLAHGQPMIEVEIFLPY